jgi:hypothetical protein
MIMQHNGSSSRRSLGSTTVLTFAFGAWSLAAGAYAAPQSVITSEDPAQPGAFSLNFGELGGVASSNITSTNYELSVDPVGGTARFVSYRQQVEPLILPGGFSTGDITVEVVEGSSTGSFDPITGQFTTSELYAVHFTGDLSAFGLTSPVLLPSSSDGALTLDAVAGGEVKMNWNGRGELANPFDPLTPLSFTYICEVNTVFAPTAANVVGLALTPDVISLQLPEGIERSLVIKLDTSLAMIERGAEGSAVRTLRAFIQQVAVLSGRTIPEADADSLIVGATETINLLRLGGTSAAASGIRIGSK